MNASAVWLVLLLAAIGANLPFLGQRLLLGRLFGRDKTLGLRLLEWLLLYGLIGLAARALENNLGQNAAQGWQFYAVTLALFESVPVAPERTGAVIV